MRQVALSPSARLAGRLAATAREHAPLVLLVALYAGAAALVGRLTGLGAVRVLVYDGEFTAVFAQFLAFVILLRALPPVAAVLARRRSPQEAWRSYASENLSVDGLGGGVMVLALVLPFFTAFTSLKRALVHLRGFGWDEAFARADLALHLGRHPWEWLHPVLGNPAITRFLDVVYMTWFPALVGVPMLMAISTRRALRMQFLLTLVASYVVLGSIVPYLTPCTDPCYYGAATGLPDPYEPLMAYLYDVHAETPLWAIANQEGLWATRLDPSWQPFGGVAGMPSMHVAYALMLMLLGLRSGRVLAVAGVVYAVLIGLGSVHLGWHYAVDGYASLIAVPLIWWGAGRFVAWWGTPELHGGSGSR